MACGPMATGASVCLIERTPLVHSWARTPLKNCRRAHQKAQHKYAGHALTSHSQWPLKVPIYWPTVNAATLPHSQSKRSWCLHTLRGWRWAWPCRTRCSPAPLHPRVERSIIAANQ
jgi:hypothetical protein